MMFQSVNRSSLTLTNASTVAVRQHRIVVIGLSSPTATAQCEELASAGFTIFLVSHESEILERIRHLRPDALLIYCLGLAGDGVALVERICGAAASVLPPILMLTDSTDETQRIAILDRGASAVLTLPMSGRELAARIRALLRLAHPAGEGRILACGEFVLDRGAHRISCNGRAIRLSPKMFRMLETMIEQPGRVFSRKELIQEAWGRSTFVEERTVDVHIRRLRKALMSNGDAALVETVRGVGYAVRTDNEPGSAAC